MFITHTPSDYFIVLILDLNSCSEKPCKNGGTCVQKSDGDFECSCPSFFEGDLCEDNRDPCLNTTCNNHGKCSPVLPLDFECSCNGNKPKNHSSTTLRY